MPNKVMAKASIGIQKSAIEIYEAIINPQHMTQYFIGSSSGKMEKDKALEWTFPEFDELCPLTVIDLLPAEKVVFKWDPETIVNITLTKHNDKTTIVKVEENGKEMNEVGIKWAIGNTEGWANFLACLKAYLEYGIRLRVGAFEFMKQ